MPTSSNAKKHRDINIGSDLDNYLGSDLDNYLGSEQEINLFGEENDFKKELIKVLKEISKRLYDIGVDIANK